MTAEEALAAAMSRRPEKSAFLVRNLMTGRGGPAKKNTMLQHSSL